MIFSELGGVASESEPRNVNTTTTKNRSTPTLTAVFRQGLAALGHVHYLAFDPGRCFRIAVRVRLSGPLISVAIRLGRSAGIRAPSEIHVNWDDRHRLRGLSEDRHCKGNAVYQIQRLYRPAKRNMPYFLAGNACALGSNRIRRNWKGCWRSWDFADLGSTAAVPIETSFFFTRRTLSSNVQIGRVRPDWIDVSGAVVTSLARARVNTTLNPVIRK